MYMQYTHVHTCVHMHIRVSMLPRARLPDPLFRRPAEAIGIVSVISIYSWPSFILTIIVADSNMFKNSSIYC